MYQLFFLEYVLLLHGHEFCLHLEERVLHLVQLSFLLLVCFDHLLRIIEDRDRHRGYTLHALWGWEYLVVLHEALDLSLALTLVFVVVAEVPVVVTVRWN